MSEAEKAISLFISGTIALLRYRNLWVDTLQPFKEKNEIELEMALIIGRIDSIEVSLSLFKKVIELFEREVEIKDEKILTGIKELKEIVSCLEKENPFPSTIEIVKSPEDKGE